MISIEPRRCRCGSRACGYCGRKLSDYDLRRLQVRQGLMPSDWGQILVTLTVNPKGYADPMAALGDERRNHRIARAVKRFGQKWGVDVHGSWRSSLEFQGNGWPHWHVLIDLPLDLVRKLPVPGVGGKQQGAFDDCWTMGFSNVNKHPKLDYSSKVAVYAVKEAVDAGEDGKEILRRSGLPAHGYKFVTTARGFWTRWGEFEGCQHEESRDGWPYEGDSVEPDEGWTTWGEQSHADRVDGCGRATDIVVSCAGGVVGSIVVPQGRRFCADLLLYAAEMYGGSVDLYEDSGFLRSVELDLDGAESFFEHVFGEPFSGEAFLSRCGFRTSSSDTSNWQAERVVQSSVGSSTA